VLLVTASYDRDIRFWEAWSGICSRTIARSGNDVGQINRLAISPDKRLLAAAIHKKVYLYEVAVQNDTPLNHLEGHSMNITSLSFHSEGKWIVTGSEDGTIRIWDLRTFSLHRKYDNGSPVNDVCVHPNQGELVSCDQSGKIRQWDLSSSESTAAVELAPGDVPVRSVGVSSDGGFMVAGDINATVHIYQINDFIRNSANPSSDPNKPRFQVVHSFKAHDRYLTRLSISPDTKSLATCSADQTIKIWSISPTLEAKLEKVLLGHQRWVWDACFSADSAYLVTASSDYTARLWEMASGDTVRQYNGHMKAAVCCALHDGES